MDYGGNDWLKVSKWILIFWLNGLTFISVTGKFDLDHLDIATFFETKRSKKIPREIKMIEKYAFTRGAKTDFWENGLTRVKYVFETILQSSRLN